MVASDLDNPLGIECLCTLSSSGGNSGTVVHDTMFWSGSNTWIKALTGLSNRSAGTSAACNEWDFTSLRLSSQLWSGQINDMVSLDTILGTFLLGVGRSFELVITGPVLDASSARVLQSTADYWVMPSTNTDSGFSVTSNFGTYGN